MAHAAVGGHLLRDLGRRHDNDADLLARLDAFNLGVFKFMCPKYLRQFVPNIYFTDDTDSPQYLVSVNNVAEPGEPYNFFSHNKNFLCNKIVYKW